MIKTKVNYTNMKEDFEFEIEHPSGNISVSVQILSIVVNVLVD